MSEVRALTAEERARKIIAQAAKMAEQGDTLGPVVWVEALESIIAAALREAEERADGNFVSYERVKALFSDYVNKTKGFEARALAAERALAQRRAPKRVPSAALHALVEPKSKTKPVADAAPCPFCGSTDIHNWSSDDHDPGNPSWSVMCFNCECEGPHTASEAKSIELWRVRAALAGSAT